VVWIRALEVRLQQRRASRDAVIQRCTAGWKGTAINGTGSSVSFLHFGFVAWRCITIRRAARAGVMRLREGREDFMW